MQIVINKFDQLVSESKAREAQHRDVVVSNRDFIESYVSGDEELSVLATKQVYQHHGIPCSFADKLADLGLNATTRGLVSDIAGEIPDTLRMIRYKDSPDGTTVRAFLSNSYERLDNSEVIQAIKDSKLGDFGLELKTSNITDNQLHMSFVSEKLEREVGTKTGDALQFGISVFNSEVGLSSFRIVPFIYRLVCQNGLIAATSDGLGSYRRFHIGKKLNPGKLLPACEVASTERKLSPEIIREKVAELLSDESIQAVMDKITAKAEQTIDAPVIQIVTNLRKEIVLTEKETELVTSYIEESDVEGPTTVYSVMNAITKVAHQARDYDRNIELQQLGWRILTNTSAKTYERPVKIAA